MTGSGAGGGCQLDVDDVVTGAEVDVVGWVTAGCCTAVVGAAAVTVTTVPAGPSSGAGVALVEVDVDVTRGGVVARVDVAAGVDVGAGGGAVPCADPPPGPAGAPGTPGPEAAEGAAVAPASWPSGEPSERTSSACSCRRWVASRSSAIMIVLVSAIERTVTPRVASHTRPTARSRSSAVSRFMLTPFAVDAVLRAPYRGGPAVRHPAGGEFIRRPPVRRPTLCP